MLFVCVCACMFVCMYVYLTVPSNGYVSFWVVRSTLNPVYKDITQISSDIICSFKNIYIYTYTPALYPDLPVSQIQSRYRACKSRRVLVVPTWMIFWHIGMVRQNSTTLSHSQLLIPLFCSCLPFEQLTHFNQHLASPMVRCFVEGTSSLNPQYSTVVFSKLMPGMCAVVSCSQAVLSFFSRQGISSTRS